VGRRLVPAIRWRCRERMTRSPSRSHFSPLSDKNKRGRDQKPQRRQASQPARRPRRRQDPAPMITVRGWRRCLTPIPSESGVGHRLAPQQQSFPSACLAPGTRRCQTPATPARRAGDTEMKKAANSKSSRLLVEAFTCAVQGLPGRPVTHLVASQRAPGSASMKQVDTWCDSRAAVAARSRSCWASACTLAGSTFLPEKAR